MRVSTRRCKACKNGDHAECALTGCYCNCGGMKVPQATIDKRKKDREKDLFRRVW